MAQCVKAQPLAAKTAVFGTPRTLRAASRTGVASASQRSVRLSVAARDAPWLPGTTAPEYLDGSLPCDYGFDPLGLGKDPANLAKFREQELIHARFAMLGVAGMVGVEAFGYGSWIDAPTWVLSGDHATYFGVDLGPTRFIYTLVSQLVIMGATEGLRAKETDPEKRLYPGFNPLGMASDDMKKKEIANGRVAMLAVFGAYMSGAVTNEGVVANWSAHVADPWAVNVATNNPLAVPFLHFSELTGSDYWAAAVPAWYPGA